jgi:hypothetical protein
VHLPEQTRKIILMNVNERSSTTYTDVSRAAELLQQSFSNIELKFHTIDFQSDIRIDDVLEIKSTCNIPSIHLVKLVSILYCHESQLRWISYNLLELEEEPYNSEFQVTRCLNTEEENLFHSKL